MQSISEKIAVLRAMSGEISEAELARRIGVSPQAFHNRMQKQRFSVDELEEIARACGAELVFGFQTEDGRMI